MNSTRLITETLTIRQLLRFYRLNRLLTVCLNGRITFLRSNDDAITIFVCLNSVSALINSRIRILTILLLNISMIRRITTLSTRRCTLCASMLLRIVRRLIRSENESNRTMTEMKANLEMRRNVSTRRLALYISRYATEIAYISNDVNLSRALRTINARQAYLNESSAYNGNVIRSR